MVGSLTILVIIPFSSPTALSVDIVYSAGFKPTRALIVTWDDVLPFKNDSHPSSLLGNNVGPMSAKHS